MLLWWCHWWLPFHDPRVVRRRWLESSDPNHPDPEAATCVPERSLVAQFLKAVDVVIVCWDMLVWVLPSWSLSLLSSLLFDFGFSESIPWTKLSIISKTCIVDPKIFRPHHGSGYCLFKNSTAPMSILGNISSSWPWLMSPNISGIIMKEFQELVGGELQDPAISGPKISCINHYKPIHWITPPDNLT